MTEAHGIFRVDSGEPSAYTRAVRQWLILAPLLAVLAACGDAPAQGDAPSKREARAKRAREALAQPPKVTKRTMDGGEFIIMDVPVDLGYGLVDVQRCFIWRDEAFRTSSMQCPADAAPALAGPPPEALYRP